MWPERFAKPHGPLRPVVERVLRGFLTCGIVSHGFARCVCETCHAHVAIPFSCRGRSFCPSCEKKRQLLWAEWLRDTLLAPVPHRHAVFTMPRLLRPLFRKRRELLDELALAGAEALTEAIREGVGEDVRPGIVVSIATAGDLVQWHPHAHVLTTDGGFSADDEFHPMPAWDGERLMALFRRRLLDRLLAGKAISPQLVSKLLCWRHPGFSSFLAEPIPFEDKRTPREDKPPPTATPPREVVRVPVDEAGRDLTPRRAP